MLNIPILRWGQPYESLDQDEVIHFATGEPLAKVSQANPGLLKRDIRQADRAREILREISCTELIGMMKKAGELYLNPQRAIERQLSKKQRAAHFVWQLA